MDAHVNIKRWGGHVLLSICDAEILGKTFREGEVFFTVREEFYKGMKMSVDEAVKLIEESTVVNMVGKNIVAKAIEKGFVHPEAVLKISNVPHAQIVKL